MFNYSLKTSGLNCIFNLVPVVITSIHHSCRPFHWLQTHIIAFYLILHKLFRYHYKILDKMGSLSFVCNFLEYTFSTPSGQKNVRLFFLSENYGIINAHNISRKFSLLKLKYKIKDEV